MTTFHRQPTRSASFRPWSSLANDLRRGLNPASQRQDAAYHGTRGVFPPVNLYESEGESDAGYVLSAELPGVDPESIEVSIEGSTVTLSGERKIEYAAGDGVAVHRRERQVGTFRRAFELPSEIDFDKAKATHKDGVLKLALPKTPAAQPRQIEIESR